MSGKFASEHADALSDIRDNGAAVVFMRRTQSHDEATGRVTPTTSTISGAAIEIKPRSTTDARRFENPALVERDPRSLLFAPDNYGEEPAPGATVEWAGKTMTVRDVYDRVAPDGYTIICKVLVSL